MKGTGLLWVEASESVVKNVLPSRDDDRPALVYWLYDETCVRPGEDGYVGVAYVHRFRDRLNEHRRSKRFKERQFKVMILREDHVNSCYLYEFTLRPHAMIGWNIAAGGARGSKIGVPKSEATKLKIGVANQGRKRPDLSERNRKMNAERNKSAVTCPHCGLVGRGPGMLGYHFDNCKHRTQEGELYPESPYGGSKEK